MPCLRPRTRGVEGRQCPLSAYYPPPVAIDEETLRLIEIV
jgi:hypothetical protein